MRFPMAVASSVVMLLVASCGGWASAADVGGRINVTRGHGIGHVFGIDFEVHEVGDGGASFTSHARHAATHGDVAGHCTLGFGEVLVEVAKRRDDTVSLRVGDRDFGLLPAGAKVVIAADRTVTVDGDVRSAK